MHANEFPFSNFQLLMLTVLLATAISPFLGGCSGKDPEQTARVNSGVELIEEAHPLDLLERRDSFPRENEFKIFIGLLGKNPTTGLVQIFSVRLPECWVTQGWGATGIREDRLAADITRRIPAFTDEWWEIMGRCGVKRPPPTH